MGEPGHTYSTRLTSPQSAPHQPSSQEHSFELSSQVPWPEHVAPARSPVPRGHTLFSHPVPSQPTWQSHLPLSLQTPLPEQSGGSHSASLHLAPPHPTRHSQEFSMQSPCPAHGIWVPSAARARHPSTWRSQASPSNPSLHLQYLMPAPSVRHEPWPLQLLGHVRLSLIHI